MTDLYREIYSEKQAQVVDLFQQRTGPIFVHGVTNGAQISEFNRVLEPNCASHIALVGDRVSLFDGCVEHALSTAFDIEIENGFVKVFDKNGNSFSFSIQSNSEYQN